MVFRSTRANLTGQRLSLVTPVSVGEGGWHDLGWRCRIGRSGLEQDVLGCTGFSACLQMVGKVVNWYVR